ncbi:MAG: penicillin-binding protein activator [Pseudomonadota bacterium]
MRRHLCFMARPARRGLRAAAAIALLGAAACTSPPPATQTQQPRSATTTTPAVDPGRPITVALFVPLGATDANQSRVAQSLVNAARLAQADLSGAVIDLRIYPTGGDPAQARTVATRAIADGARIFVGPLFGSVAQAVGPIADQAGINVLTFSTTPSVAGKNVFLLGQTAATEADRLVSYAASQGIGTMGLFYPQTPSGQVAVQALRAAASRNGVLIVTAVDYPRSFQGIQDRSELYGTQHSAEAVVIPERGEGLISAAAFLNYNNVSPVETQYLGLGQWNDQGITAEAALAGGWFVAPDPDLFAVYAERYRATYGEAPPPISGLAYDGIAVVGALIRDARQSGDAAPFSVDNLTNAQGFAGVNGIFRLRRDGMIDRALAVMEVTKDGFTIRDPAPRRFARPAG